MRDEIESKRAINAMKEKRANASNELMQGAQSSSSPLSSSSSPLRARSLFKTFVADADRVTLKVVPANARKTVSEKMNTS
jgi:hypothetical protein